MEMVATCAFGIEAVLRREMLTHGFNMTKRTNGRIYFTGDADALYKANMALRTAERIHLVLSRARTETFDALFEHVASVPWHQHLDDRGRYEVHAKSVASKLFSLRDIQAIAKKALIRKFQEHRPGHVFSETGSRYVLTVQLKDDICEIWLDTSGEGLHKRGYRQAQGEAPIKETLGAALVLLSFYEKGRHLYDPFCGSGTIPIEAAMIAANIAPNLDRGFAFQALPWYDSETFSHVRRTLMKAIDMDGITVIEASDIDDDVVKHAQDNARRAGVDAFIRFETVPFSERHFEARYGIVITNPPYALRLETDTAAETIYRSIAQMYRRHPDYSLYLLSAYPGIEKIMKKQANKTRVIFNGNVKSRYYQYYGPRPQ